MEFRNFVDQAVDGNARWLHLVSGTVPVMQLSSGVKSFDVPRLSPPEVYQLVDQIISADDKKKLLEEGELLFRMNFDEEHAMRVHVYKQRGTLAISAKILENRIWDLDETGFPAQLKEAFLKQKQGLLIFSSASDSGRTTTLNAFINEIALRSSSHIVSISDCIEGRFVLYDNTLISRRVYGQDVIDIDEYWHSLVKEPIDLLSLGELDSVEKLFAALEIAGRGVLVLGTVLGSDVENVLSQLYANGNASLDVPLLLSERLSGVYHQKMFCDYKGEKHFLCEGFTSNSVVARHLRDSNVYALKNYLKTSGRSDCLSYVHGFRDLANRAIIDEEEVPLKYRA